MKIQNIIHPASWATAPADVSKHGWPLVGWLEIKGPFGSAPAPGLEAMLEARWPMPHRETVSTDRSARVVAIFSDLPQ